MGEDNPGCPERHLMPPSFGRYPDRSRRPQTIGKEKEIAQTLFAITACLHRLHVDCEPEFQTFCLVVIICALKLNIILPEFCHITIGYPTDRD
jgi:hypothetical protein